MPFSGNTFTRLQSWINNATLGLKIRADLMDQDTNDIAGGLTIVKTLIANLATATGALALGILAYPDAVLTTVFERLTRVVYVDDYLSTAQKADVRGLTESLDVSTPFQNAINRMIAIKNATLRVGNGFYRVDQSLSAHSDFSMNFIGEGSGASVIRVHHDLATHALDVASSTPGSTFANRVDFRGLSIRATVPQTQCIGLRLNMAQLVHATDVNIEDCWRGLQIEGGLTQFFTGVHINSGRSSGSAAWPGVVSGSTYCTIDRASGGHISSEIFFTGCNFRRSDTANYVQNALVVNCADGVWFNGHLMGVDQDQVHVEPTSNDRQISGLKFVGAWLDNNCTNGLHVLGTTTASFLEIELTGTKIFQPSNCGIFVEDTAVGFEGVRMTGGSIIRAGNFGALLRNGSYNVFTGVQFHACNVNAASNAGGIVVGSGPTVTGGPALTKVMGCLFSSKTQTFNIAAMQGVTVLTGVTGMVVCNASHFDLNASAPDVADSSGNEANNYEGCTTTKTPAITTLAGGSLQLDELSRMVSLAGSLGTATNMTGRRGQRRITMIALATGTTIQNGANFQTKSGSDILSSPGVLYEFIRYTPGGKWYQVA